MDEREAPATGSALPDLILYSRPGCHLCDDTRSTLQALLAQRAAGGAATPRLVERDITANPDWERAWFASIPVVELGERRLELATSVGKLRALLASIDGATGANTAPAILGAASAR